MSERWLNIVRVVWKRKLSGHAYVNECVHVLRFLAKNRRTKKNKTAKHSVSLFFPLFLWFLSLPSPLKMFLHFPLASSKICAFSPFFPFPSTHPLRQNKSLYLLHLPIRHLHSLIHPFPHIWIKLYKCKDKLLQ